MDIIIEWLPIVLALVATGIVAGLLAGLLGVGGGIVITIIGYYYHYCSLVLKVIAERIGVNTFTDKISRPLHKHSKIDSRRMRCFLNST